MTEIRMADFYPPRPVTMDDFFPPGKMRSRLSGWPQGTVVPESLKPWLKDVLGRWMNGMEAEKEALEAWLLLSHIMDEWGRQPWKPFGQETPAGVSPQAEPEKSSDLESLELDTRNDRKAEE